MSSKALIMAMLGVSLYITISKWYEEGNTGQPPPTLVGPAAYLFGILALTADFLSGIPVLLSVALTFILFLRSKNETGSNTTTGGTTAGGSATTSMTLGSK